MNGQARIQPGASSAEHLSEAEHRFGTGEQARQVMGLLAKRQMSTDEVAHLRQTLEREAARRRRRVVLYSALTRAYVVSYLAILAARLVFKQHVEMAYWAPVVWAILGVGLWCKRASAVQKAGVTDIAGLDDIAAVGPLAQGLDFEWAGAYDQDHAVADVAADALIRLLPSLKASDSGLLNDDQRACLRRALGGKNRALTMAILGALERVGDARDLPAIEKLTRAGGRGRRDIEVRNLAVECLGILRERAENQKVAMSLLRPATAPDHDTLLRPAMDSGSAESAVLLRAADPAQEPT